MFLESCSWTNSSASGLEIMSPDSLRGSPCSWSTSEPESHEEITSFVTGYEPPAKRHRISFDSPSVSVVSLPSCEWSDDVSTPDFSKEITKARRSPHVSKKKRLTDFYTEDTSSCHYPREGKHASVTVSDNWCLFGILELNGCREACAVSVQGLSEYDILSAHSNFISKTCTQQRYWIFDYFISHCPNNEQGIKDLKNMLYILSGKSVCCSLWLAALSISSSRFYKIQKEFIDGKVTPSPRQPRAISVKSHQAIAWLSSFVERIGDKRPDKDGVFLPMCLTVKAIYIRMVEELYRGDSDKAICFSQFNRLFRLEFSNVSIPKECRFTKCTFCTLIKNEIQKLGITKQEKTKLNELLDDHLKLQEQERQRYYGNRQKAIECPDEVVSVIVDGMDQNKTNIPSIVRVSKACQNLWCLRTHLTGCLVHGFGSCNFIDFLQWPHDCNLTLSVLFESFLQIAKHQLLPSRLFVQMDNCVRENKNKYVFGFLALLLVEIGMFTEIELGFLIVGHTHEDIDQTFSCVSRLGCLSPCLEEIHGHTVPHIFLFRKSPLGKSVMFYKNWSHEQWEPQDGLKLLKKHPEGSPALVTPNMNKIDLPHLKGDIVKYYEAGVLTSMTYPWWQSFLNTFELTYCSLPEENPVCLLDTLVEIRKSNPMPASLDPFVLTIIENMHKNQMESHAKIQLGKKKRASGELPESSNAVHKHKSKHVKKKDKRAPAEIRNEICHIPENLSSGKMVALRLVKYFDEIPQIGKVVSVSDMEVTIEWFIGSYSDVWISWKRNNKVVKETVPKNAVIYSDIDLTKSSRLKPSTRKALQELYEIKELI